jgi:hypothetical protein
VADDPLRTGSPSRLIANDLISVRITDLKTLVAEGVIDVEIRKRSARVKFLNPQSHAQLG